MFAVEVRLKIEGNPQRSSDIYGRELYPEFAI